MGEAEMLLFRSTVATPVIENAPAAIFNATPAGGGHFSGPSAKIF